MVILNGLGCSVSGARMILQELVSSCPKNLDLYVIAPQKKGYKKINAPTNVKIYYLNHNLWKGFLRLIPELIINLLLFLRISKLCINISNYGLCICKPQILYIHNQYMIDPSEKSIGLFIKRFMLSTFLKRGQFIGVQTDHMARDVKKYIELNGNSSIPIKIFAPLTNNLEHHSPIKKTKKRFEFEFFYPASSFVHKHSNLAMEAVTNNMNPNIGLAITIDKNDERDSKKVYRMGQVSHSEILSRYEKANALLFTSTRESLGLPLLEALEFELPAVLPDLDYAREIYGEAAVYYSENNSTSISTAIDHLISNYAEYKYKTTLRKKSEWSKRITWCEHWTHFLN